MVIFLDVDGVLNQLQRNYYIDVKCVRILARICKKLKGTIVLTSSWRLGYTHTGTCSPQIEQLKELFAAHGIKISGRTGVLGDRTLEIKDYIKRHNVKNYLVLDDDKSEFKSGWLLNTYIVNYKTGLVVDDIKAIKEMYYDNVIY